MPRFATSAFEAFLLRLFFAWDASALVLDEANRTADKADLVLMHIPFNAGHALELVGMLPEFQRNFVVPVMQAKLNTGVATSDDGRSPARMLGRLLDPFGLSQTTPKKDGGVLWGRFNEDLDVVNEVSGCPMYFTPPKYWPEELAARYFGDKTIFGVLRDPFDRVTSFFKGNVKGYGGSYTEYLKTCDVNGAVKFMMKDYLAGNKFKEQCTFVPQAEYFEGKYGVKIPVDFQTFPRSVNKLFREHRISNMETRPEDVPHVHTCMESWGGDLDEETVALVKKVYKADFDLICKHFGYCDYTPKCMYQVHDMCPEKAFAWDSDVKEYLRRGS